MVLSVTRRLVTRIVSAVAVPVAEVLAENAAVKDVEISGETPARPGVQRTGREMFYPIHDQAGQAV